MGDPNKRPDPTHRSRKGDNPTELLEPCENARLYKAVFAHISSPLSIWTPDGDGDFVLRDLNSACATLNRLDRDRSLGRPLTELYPEAESLGLPEAMHRASTRGEDVHLPPQVHRTPFATRWREFTLFPLPTGEIVLQGDDVSDRMRSQIRMRESLELFSRIFEEAFAVMLLIDPHTGSIVEANAKACEFYGYNRNELKSLKVWDINTLSEDETRRRMALANAQQRNVLQMRHCLASGEIREVEVHSGPVTIIGQDLLYSIIHDVTERLVAEEALRQSEAALQGLFRSAPVGIGEIKDRIIGRVNDRFCEITGYSAAELTGKSSRMLYASDQEFQRVTQLRESPMKDKGFGSLETMIQRKDGQQRHILVTASWKDEQNQDVGVIFTALDITERKRAEEAERELHRDLRGIIDAMPSAVFCVDEDGRIVLWNSQAKTMTGSDALTGMLMTEAVPDLQEFEAMLAETIDKHEPLNRKSLPLERGGMLTFWDLLIYPLPEGRIHGAAVRLDDVTERIHLEEIMIQSEKMLSLGGLAAGMAHEINNPLGGIMQGAQNIERRFSPGLPANRRVAESLGLDLDGMSEYLERRGIVKMLGGIRSSGERAAQIVTNMLNFSRGSGSRRAPVDIEACIEKTLELARSDYDLKNKYDFRLVRIQRDFEPLPPVPGTESELQQVFLNLVVNAAQAMAQWGGEGRLPELRISTRLSPAGAVISVVDNGPGIEPEKRKRIFEPFYTTKAPGEGTGLGLSVAYFIITRNHGGTITVDAPPGGAGTRFTITLPL